MTNEEKAGIARHVQRIEEMAKLLPVPAPDSKAELALSIIHAELDAIEGECVPTRKPRKPRAVDAENAIEQARRQA